MKIDLAGKRALVLASSKGIGKEIAKNLAQCGCDLYLVARTKSLLDKLQEEIEQNFKVKVIAQALDLKNIENIHKLIADIDNINFTPDIIIHNSGGPKVADVLELNATDWLEAFSTMVLPIVEINNHFVPKMIANGSGRIIAITSLSVMEPIDKMALSNSIRACITNMLKTLANEIAKYNITVNCIAPGWIETDRTKELLNARIKNSILTPDEYMKNHLSTIPAARIGDVKELANLAVFLASPLASYITGSTFSVDGGKRKSSY